MKFELKDNSQEAVTNAIFEISEGDGFWYGVNNEYIEPEQILKEGDTLNKVKEAIDTLSLFHDFILDLEGE
jgi:hypothetical protein